VGSGIDIDIATLTFELPIFISAPALVKKLGVIQKIIANVFDANGNLDDAIYNDANLLSKQYITPLQYGVILLDNQLRLVASNQSVDDKFGTQIVKELAGNISANTTVYLTDADGIKPSMIVSNLSITSITSNTIQPVSNCAVISVSGDTVITSNVITGNIGDKIVFTDFTRKNGADEPWRNIVNIYGNLVNGSSTVKLELEDETLIVGTVAYSPIDDTVLLWSPDIDSLPTNTLPPINAIIDPVTSRPNYSLQDLAVGTRYLLVNDYVLDSNVVPYYNWTGIDDTPLEAYKNDIIEFTGQHWAVVFDSRNEIVAQYVTNLTTGIQYKWDATKWTKSYEGYYPAGKWQLII
jgi:hypothetical protein